MSKKLLLADDSVVIQKLVGLSFANEDLEIETTDNGDDAIAKAREIVPDIVLADVVMPGKSGYEVCEAIKQDPALAHIPVLLLTGTFEAFDEARANAAGSDGQITKPFEAQSLVERVNQVMNAPRAAVVKSAAPPSGQATDTSDISDAARAEDYDFFENDVTTLSDEDAADDLLANPESLDLTPSLDAADLSGGGDVSDDDFFGAPGDGASDELDTQGGGLAIGESVARDGSAEADATIAMLPSQSAQEGDGADPLVGFEDDLGLNEPFSLADATPPTPVDLDAVLDSPPGARTESPVSRAEAEAEATIVVPTPAVAVAPLGIDLDESDAAQNEAATSGSFRDDLTTVHVPKSPASGDQNVAAVPTAAAPFPTRPNAAATVVTNLDESLAQPPTRPDSRAASLDLGPANLSGDDLDFSFDVSEQASTSEIPDPLAESFSSLMDISESQILSGPQTDEDDEFRPEDGDPLMTDSIAAGYDVSTSDLATAAPTPMPTVTPVETPIAAPARTPAIEPPKSASTPADFAIGTVDASDDSFSGSTTAEPDDRDAGLEIASPAAESRLELGTPRSTDPLRDRISDLSPMVEQRIQEILEKVAWEAFSDLSESIVKQVIGRVEQIAWQVIPEMAETLVREEIRKMKGDKD